MKTRTWLYLASFLVIPFFARAEPVPAPPLQSVSFVLDKSGSMSQGDRLPRARQAIRVLGDFMIEGTQPELRPKPPCTVVLIPGLGADGGMWDALAARWTGTRRWTSGGRVDTAATTPVPAADFYALDLASNTTLTFAEQGALVASAVERIRAANGNKPVLLVGHSMGGLAARAYISYHDQNGAKTCGLLTIGTPHQGSIWGYLHDESGTTSASPVLKQLASALGKDLSDPAIKALQVPPPAPFFTSELTPAGTRNLMCSAQARELESLNQLWLTNAPPQLVYGEIVSTSRLLEPLYQLLLNPPAPGAATEAEQKALTAAAATCTLATMHPNLFTTAACLEKLGASALAVIFEELASIVAKLDAKLTASYPGTNLRALLAVPSDGIVSVDSQQLANVLPPPLRAKVHRNHTMSLFHIFEGEGVMEIDAMVDAMIRAMPPPPGASSPSAAPLDRLSVVAFDTAAGVVVPFGSGLDRDGLRQRLEALQGTGGTSIAGGLATAAALPAPTAQRTIILVSDGEDPAAAEHPVVEQLAGAGVVVHTIGLNIPQGSATLRRISGRCGGLHSEADELSLLQAAATAALMGAAGDMATWVSQTGIAIQDGVTAIPLHIGPFVKEQGYSALARMILTWHGSRLDVRLKAADGTLTPLRETDRGPNYLIAEASSLATGDYTVEVVGTQVPQGGEAFQLMVMGPGGGQGLTVAPMPTEHPAGHPLRISMGSSAALPPDLKAEFTTPSGRKIEAPVAITGNRGELVVSDTNEIGLYTGRLTSGGGTTTTLGFRVGSVPEVMARIAGPATRLKQVAGSARQAFEKDARTEDFNLYVCARMLSRMGHGFWEAAPVLEAARTAENTDGSLDALASLFEKFPLKGLALLRGDRLAETRGRLSLGAEDMTPDLLTSLREAMAPIDRRFLMPLGKGVDLLCEANGVADYATTIFRPEAVRQTPPDWRIVDLAVAYQLSRNLPAFLAGLESRRLVANQPARPDTRWLASLLPGDFPFLAVEMVDAKGTVYFRDEISRLEPAVQPNSPASRAEELSCPILGPERTPAGGVKIRLLQPAAE